MAKSNADLLRDILNGLSKENSELDFSEAFEFVDAMEQEIERLDEKATQKDEEIDDLKSKNQDLEEVVTGLRNDLEDKETEYSKDENLGIGSIQWATNNIALESEIQKFIHSLKVKYGMQPK